MAQVGQVVVNRYRLERVIGSGGMGTVYLAKDLRLHNDVALKFLSHTVNTPAMCDRFLLEARVCAQLGQRSKHIVLVTDFGRDADDVPLIVMEYLPGQSLRKCLEAQPLPLLTFLKWTEQICVGLKCAHEGIEIEDSKQRHSVIHCDIKPSNIFVTPNDLLGEWVKILDFGVAKLVGDKHQVGTFNGGTYPYCSPEQLETKPLDPRSDIYSLGIMMFEMLTQQRHLQAITHDYGGWYNAHRYQTPHRMRSLAPDVTVPTRIEELVMQCLAKSPEQRPQSIAEVLGAVRSLLDTQSPDYRPFPISPMPEPSTATTQRASPEPPLLVFPSLPQGQRVLCQPTPPPEQAPALWVKLPHAEIQTIQIYRLYNKIYQGFWSCLPPNHHPMLLWVTAIANQSLGTRLFTHYLNLRTREGYQLIQLLTQTNTYQYLFFDQEEPSGLSHRITRQLTTQEQAEIRKIAVFSLQPSSGTPQQSRAILAAIEQQIRDRMNDNDFS